MGLAIGALLPTKGVAQMNVELKKNILVRANDTIYRIFVLEETRVFLIDCVKKTMPRWMEISSLEVDSYVTEADMREETQVTFPMMEELSTNDKKVAHERYTLIAGVLALADDEDLRSKLITKVANENGINRRTVTNYLCTYLVYQDIAALAPRQRQEKKALTKDQKNIRWALNKYYYTRHGNTLADAYVFMLKEKYTNLDGTLKEKYPSIHQFRYFYKQNKSLQTEYISRGGIKDYQMNHRPLLGDGVQEFAPNVGVGMLDATICDIYLCDDSGNLVGRPVLVACVDAYSGICCGYSLLWEGGVYSIRELLLNVVTNKVEWCKNFGILISQEDWNCDKLPGILVTDMGSEYKSFHFEQISDLGCTVVNLPSFRPELKGPVEKLFSLVQDSFKPYLKGKGVIEPDFQKRGQHDYRKDARLTLRDFETIILRCIIHHNKQRILENFPYTEDMLAKEIKANNILLTLIEWQAMMI
jgi:hypothetical protein